jgi:hypothetical protein
MMTVMQARLAVEGVAALALWRHGMRCLGAYETSLRDAA